MPHWKDDSKAHNRIIELERELQEAKAELDQALSEPFPLDSAQRVAERERQLKTLTDRVQSLAMALELQRALASDSLHAQELQIAQGAQKKLKNFGFRPVKIRFLGGLEITLFARYWCRNEARCQKGKGWSLGLVLLGICDRCTPALASEVAQLAAALSSFEDAQARLHQMGITMSINKIASVSYHFSERARQRQLVEGMGIEGSLAGRRVVVSTDGGRIRVRKNKRGKKTKKGRRRYRTDWREPKLLVIYVVDEEGRIDKEFTPVIDGTLKGPDAVFRLLEYYLSQLDVTEADRVLFIADGAKWIWKRVAGLWQRLGLKDEQCLELVDFYHVVEHLNRLAGLEKSWSRQRRTSWATRQRKRLLSGEVAVFTQEIKKFCRGKRGKDWRRERDYLLRNAETGRLNYAAVRSSGLPIGSGTMESAVRRVVNLRMKGPSIFWAEGHAEQMLLLRTYYKSKQWQVLETKAFTPLLQLAA